MNLFELATRYGYRYVSPKGDLTTEQLWELPLSSKSGFDLDSVAKGLNANVKAVTEESFVSESENPGKALATTKLEIVKHIIAVKLADKAAATTALGRKAERERLMEILAKKQDASLESLSVEELTAKLNSLG